MKSYFNPKYSIILTVGFFFMVSAGFAQGNIQDPIPFPGNYYDHPVFTKARQYSKALDWKNADLYWSEFSLRYPAERPGYLEGGSASLGLGKHAEAVHLLEQAYIMNSADARTIGEYIMACAVSGDEAKAKELASQLARLSTSQYYAYYNDYFGKEAARYSGAAQSVLQGVKAQYSSTYQQVGSFDNWSAGFNQIINKKGKSWDAIIQNLKNYKGILRQRGVHSGAYHWLVKDMYDYVEYKFGLGNVVAEQLVQIMVEEYHNAQDINPYYKVYFGQHQFNQYLAVNDYDRAYALNSLLISAVMEENKKFRYNLIDLYIERARLLYMMGRFNEFEGVASSLIQVLGDYKNPLFKAEGYEALALMNSRNGNLDKGVEYGLKSLEILQQNKLSGEDRVRSLLTIIYSNKGDIATALKYSGFGEDENSYMALFNIATILESNERYEEAIGYYTRSLNKFDTQLSQASSQEQLTMLGSMGHLYSGLAFSYVMEKEHVKAFETIERSKTKLLAKAIGLKEASTFKASELQSKLAADEVYLSYKINGASSFLVSFVTKQKVITGSFGLRNLIRPLKKNFSPELKALDEALSRKEFKSSEYVGVSNSAKENEIPINNGDFELVVELLRLHLTGSLNDYIKTDAAMTAKIGQTISTSFYLTFVDILNELLSGQKKLIISADGALNFIPFEALLNRQGNYLAQEYQIKMVPSAAVWLQLKKRTYNTPRKEVIAFGGAIYEETQSNVQPVASLKDVNSWQLRSYDLVEQGKPLTDLFKAMGYGKMNYLAGTLAEVKEIGEIYAGSSQIITGKEMTEKKVKDLSSTGMLKQYKVVHFATHGWAMNAMPKASGLAMCIPKVSTDGEDGTLVAKELSQLDLNADMVMLSACETGLGKLYGGEGVSGLNQALLIAGANSTIVSLWPVNDYATSILVKELYRIVKDEKVSHAQALLKVKRNFISGKYNTTSLNLQAPIYWAPFIYNGK